MFPNFFCENISWACFLICPWLLCCPPQACQCGVAAQCGTAAKPCSKHKPAKSTRHVHKARNGHSLHSELTLINSAGSWSLESAAQSVVIWMKKPRAELKLVRRGRLYFSASCAIIPRDQKPGKQESPDGTLPCS